MFYVKLGYLTYLVKTYLVKFGSPQKYIAELDRYFLRLMSIHQIRVQKMKGVEATLKLNSQG